MPTIDRNTFNPRYFTKYFTKRLALASGLVAISTLNYAFDQQAFNSTQAMVPFAQQFGKCSAKTGKCALETYYVSLLNSLVYVGFAIGAYIGSVISARYGRRMTIFYMSLWALVTATMLVTSGVSGSKWQVLVGRVLNYIYIGMELSTVPVYQSEVVPAPVRGFAVGSYQLSLSIGGLIINGICNRTSKIPNNAAWMIPYGLFYIVPTFVASLIWFIPESPRWLLMNDREEDALRSLKQLCGEGYEEISPEVELELIKASLLEEQGKGSYADLFKGYNRRRTLLVCAIAFFFQATGQFFSGHYGALFVQSLGTISPFTITVTQSGINTVTSFIGILLIDRVGRRPLWLVGSLVMGAALFTMGALGVKQPRPYSFSSGIIAMMLVFQLTYVATVGPLYYTMVSEIPASRLRDKTVRIGSIVNIVTIFVVSFTLPYLLNAPYADLGSKVGFIYGSICFVALAFGYFFLPELRGRSLEELDAMFEAQISLRKFGRWEPDPNVIGAAVARVKNLEATGTA
ncbi:sugar transporter [Xylariaceae sp. FL0255]|nr:sugar transporter [Xylariaceae sp. FL0255]